MTFTAETARTWDKERTRLLKDLWQNTCWPASEIAEKLEVSRNAVIGKANRMGYRRIQIYTTRVERRMLQKAEGNYYAR